MILDQNTNTNTEEQKDKNLNEDHTNDSSVKNEEKINKKNKKVDQPADEKSEKKLDKKLINKINNDLVTKNLNLELEISKLRDKIKTYENDFKSQIQAFEEKGNQKVKELKEELHKKFEQESKNLKLYGSQSFFENFLSPFLNLKMAIDFGSNSNDANVANYVKGFNMLFTQLETIMENFGITKIEPEVNQIYNPENQQIYQLENGKKDNILKVQSIGFKLHDRVIKPALVVVGNGNDK